MVKPRLVLDNQGDYAASSLHQMSSFGDLISHLPPGYWCLAGAGHSG
jgi:hypothetical protein